MKKLYTFGLALIAAVACLFLLPTEAQAAKEGYYTYKIENGGAIITDCDTSISGDIIIPSSLDGCQITAIDSFAFEECHRLTSVTIPDSVTSIGMWAFNNCTKLTSVVIPDSITKISDSAFRHCSSLTSVTIPHSVTCIDTYAFSFCYGLTSIAIPDSVTSIQSGAFYSCYSLTGVTIPDGVTTISSYAFYDCRQLTSIAIPDSVTSIGWHAFDSCSELVSITIPDSVTYIDSCAFSGCDALTDVYFEGTKAQWNAINIIGSDNKALLSATIHYSGGPEAELNVNRAIIRLQEQMKMGFYYEMATEETVLETGAIVWTGEEYAKETAFDINHTYGKKYSGKAENTDGTYYSIETDGIPAQAIDTVLYILPYAKTATGYSYAEVIKSNSILNVAKNQYNDSETTDDVKAVIVDVLNYATAARNYFVAKGEMEAPAKAFNAILTDAEKALAWSDELLAVRSSVTETESEYAPKTDKVYINIEDSLKIQFVFADSSVVGGLHWQGKDYTGSAVHDSTTATGQAHITKQNGYVSCAIRGINSYNIYDDFYLRGYNAQGQLTKTYTHSIAAYLTNQIKACEGKTDAESQALVELCKAMLIYGKSAQENDAVNKGE